VNDAAAVLEEEEESSRRDLEHMLDDSQDHGLKVADLAILAFLGAKVAVPIVCSFVSRELWERYNRIRTRAQAKQAQADLAGKSLGEAQAEKESVIDAVVDILREEGISEAAAEDLALQAYTRVQARVPAVDA
jgi:hypothetical protein